MNEEEYIASGLLESYALGLTTEAETAEVERALTRWPALQAHVEALHEDLEEYVMAYAQTPPPALRGRVLDALAAEETRTVPLRTDSGADAPPVIRPRWGQAWLVAASVGLLILSLLGNLLLYGRWQGTEQRLEVAESRNTQLADRIGVQETRLETFSDEIALLRNPAVRRIELKAQPNAPASATALVYWNAQSRTAYLASTSLPAAPVGQQYQLWAIVDGKPVAMEVFDAGTGFRQVSNIANAQAFAISLEARGGSTTEKGPQGPVYVLGAV